MSVRDLSLLAVDLETTGLHPKRDRVLSVGFVPIDGLSIDLSGARRFVVQAGVEVGQSATIHGITDDDCADGTPLEEVLSEVLAALRGRVLLAHYTDIEERFLSAACERVYGARMPVARIDTLELHRRLIVRWGEAPMRLALRLWTARERYGLPIYRAHEALIDAVSCAELFLAQVAEMQADGREITLAKLAS
ncbi:MAG: DNA polymerase III subunit epsilon [Actinomycetales bacterium]|nr:DNA polymerase III subunit epsilon [Actinomycetales bacterium]